MNRFWNIDSLLPLLREAGKTALQKWRDPAVELKTDRSVVTAADKEIEALFASRFDRPQEGSYLIGEETVSARSEAYIKAAMQGTTYVVDPIDGTAPYVSHLPLWGCSIALMEQGVLKEGAIFFPEHDELFITCRGTLFLARGVMKDDVDMQPFTPVRMPLSSLRPVSLSQIALKRGWRVKFEHEAFVFSSCLGSFYHLLHGDFCAVVQDCKLWDLAAGMVILQAAGYAFMHQDGTTFPMDMRHGGVCDLRSDAPVPFRCPKTLLIASSPEDARQLWRQIDTTTR